MEQQLQKTTEVILPKETLEAFGGDELRARVFYEKYALRDESGKQVEKVPKQLWQRVARELASVEVNDAKRTEWTEKFYWLLDDFKFVPGGRIMFGAGQSRRSTLLNCYFFKIREDSIEGIFDWCKEAARTYSFGGGVGTDISLLRPRGHAGEQLGDLQLGLGLVHGAALDDDGDDRAGGEEGRPDDHDTRRPPRHLRLHQRQEGPQEGELREHLGQDNRRVHERGREGRRVHPEVPEREGERSRRASARGTSGTSS